MGAMLKSELIYKSQLQEGLKKHLKGITLCKIGRLSEPAKGRLLFDQFWVIPIINLVMMPRGGSDNIIAIHGCRRCLIKPKSKSKSLIQYLIFGILKILSWWWHLEFTWEDLYYCYVIG